MHYFWRFFFVLSLGAFLIVSCSKPVPPRETLYQRLGGEKTLVALSLQVSRKQEIHNNFHPEEVRIFRQRLAEWLCHASSGPCKFPTNKEFFNEIRMNTDQKQQLLRVLKQVLKETQIPKTEREELLLSLSHNSL